LIEARSLYWDLKARNTVSALNVNGFDAYYEKTLEDALAKTLSFVPSEALVGLGGSVTLREMGVPDILRKRGNRVADHWDARRNGASHDKIREIRMQHLNSDVFLTSTNAVTEDGQLINVDGGGQRVAAMIYGPKRVIVVTGVNKIVGNIDEGIWRARNVTAPMNTKRLSRKTPCVETGVCGDCDSSDRICNATTIIHRRPRDTEIIVILVNKELGY
jgi:L-lactate utilization protein LutB